jgi:hypothetical protein
MQEPTGEEELVIIGHRKTRAEKDIISPHSIYGSWVQWQQTSEVYPDPVTAASEAASFLIRDCENRLMELFEYQNIRTTGERRSCDAGERSRLELAGDWQTMTQSQVSSASHCTVPPIT